MRTILASLLLLSARPTIGVEARSELTIGREFVFLTNDVEAELIDGQLALGGGVTLVSDYTIERYGAEALIEYRGAHVSLGVKAAFGPKQAQRGWASLDPHLESSLERGRAKLHLDGGVLLRRLDAEARRTKVALDQLQLHAEVELTLDERWRLGLVGLYSFYDPDPSLRRLRGLDLGLAVTLAGRPERWAAGARLGKRLSRRWWIDVSAAYVAYANQTGSAVVPKLATKVGAFGGVSVAASAELVVDLASSMHEAPRAIGGLLLEYER